MALPSMLGPKRLEISEAGDVTIVNFSTKKILDEETIRVVGEQLLGLLDGSSRKKIVVSFGNLEYMNAAFLGKIIVLENRLGAIAGKLVLCNIPPAIFDVFEITQLNRRFSIFKDEKLALSAF